MTPVAITIAGSDPSGGAGVQADLKTFHRFGVYGEAAITLLTVQNSVRVDRVECLDPELVIRQVKAAIEDIPPGAGKTGALGNRAIVEAVAELARGFAFPLVVDPVTISKHGLPLIAAEAKAELRDRLLPCAYVVTPNLPEAADLTGLRVDTVAGMRDAAKALVDLGARSALVKGGHLAGDAIDVLYAGGELYEFAAPRIDTRHTHGTGCTYASAIAALLALGHDLPDAVARAKRFITEAIRTNPGLGAGSGPVNHFAVVDSRE